MNGHVNGVTAPRDLHTMRGKVAFITGGASGIGFATAQECARRGANVAIVDLRLEAAVTAAASLKQDYGISTLALACDVADNMQVEEAVRRTVEQLGGLHMALNSAGMPAKGALVGDYPVDNFKRMIDVHLTGCFLCVRAEINAMLRSGGGSIVNVSSLAGQVALGPQVAYVAAKHAVTGITKTAAAEYASKGIRVNAVAPGFIETPLLTEMAASVDRSADDAGQLLGQATPIGRTAQPDEVGRVIAFLLSDEASYVTGGFYPVDGGYLTVGRC